MKIRAREGDLLETTGNILFDVKGLVHPPNRVVAFIRYVPDPEGNRERDGTRYSKFYSLYKRYALLKQKFPHMADMTLDPENVIIKITPKICLFSDYTRSFGYKDRVEY